MYDRIACVYMGFAGALYTAFISSILCCGCSEIAYGMIGDKDCGGVPNKKSGEVDGAQ